MNTGISSEEDRALSGIEARFKSPVISDLIAGLRRQAEKLHSTSQESVDEQSPEMVAENLAIRLAARMQLPKRDATDHLARWAHDHEIHCSSHQETVAAVLLLYIPLAERLAEEYLVGKPHLDAERYKNKARYSVAKGIWRFGPQSGTLDEFLTQFVSGGLRYYEQSNLIKRSSDEPSTSFMDQRDGNKIQISTLPISVLPLSTRDQIAEDNYSPVFRYAASKDRGKELNPKLKQVAYRSLMHHIHLFNPEEHGHDFAVFAHSRIFADIDAAWERMQVGNVSPGESPTGTVDGILQVTSIPPAEECMSLSETTSATAVMNAANVEGEQPNTEVLNVVHENSPIVGLDVVSLDSDVTNITPVTQIVRIDEAQVLHAPHQKTLSHLQQRRAAAAAKNQNPQDSTIATASPTPSSAAPLAYTKTIEQVDPVAQVESDRQAAVVDYVQKQENGGEHVHSYEQAVDLLITNNAGAAKSDAMRVLPDKGEKRPKAAAAQTASAIILRRLAQTFSPPSSAKKYFRGYLRDAIKEGILMEYKKHC